MVNMTIYIDVEVFCFIFNCMNKSMEFEWGDTKKVSLEKTKKYPYEIQVPITVIGQINKKDETTINLYELQLLNNKNEGGVV